MGLFVAKKIIEKAKGKIKVASEENKCTEFTISLPIQAKCSIFGNEQYLVDKNIVILKKNPQEHKLKLAKDTRINHKSVFTDYI